MKLWSFDGPRNVHLCMAALQMLHCNIRFPANEGLAPGHRPDHSDQASPSADVRAGPVALSFRFPVTAIPVEASQSVIRCVGGRRMSRSASIAVFPASRQRNLVQDIARQLSALHGNSALAFWKDTARDLVALAVQRGSTEPDARDEVRRVFSAVQAELQAGMRSADHSAGIEERASL